MAKKSAKKKHVLVVVESPAKAKTIEKYLGDDYKVMASKGHIVDLPKSGLAVDIENNYEPQYAVMENKQDVIKALKEEMKGKDKLIIAVDPDREGEAIGWHVASELDLVHLNSGRRKNSDIALERIVFTEITKDAVQEALKKPRELDPDLLSAQQARRVLDRLVGYKLSPLLWKKIRYGLSAGRVQSVALKLIVDREKERDAFNPEEYWTITAWLEQKETNAKSSKPEIVLTKKDEEKPKFNGIPFELSKVGGKKPEVEKEVIAKELVENLIEEQWIISKLETKQTKRNPKPPFTTSTLQQTAANWFGFSAKRTMSLAQKLYEQGHITYMRTDSTNMSKQALSQARKYLENKYGKEMLPENPRVYRTKAKVAQEAHEAIRPASFKKTPGMLKLDKDLAKLYELIWQRALASQAAEAKLESATAEIEITHVNTSYTFRATGQRVLDKGYLEIYPEKVSEVLLPKLKEGDRLTLNTLSTIQHFTQPPARYSEATLVKELEKNGIGRPSTYAPIISTIQGRKYVEKEGKYFYPTDTGKVVTALLADNFADIVDLDFTAELEENLDRVANGEVEWEKVISDFYKPFSKNLEEKQENLDRSDYTVLGKAPNGMTCPDCGAKMLLKLGKNGKFYTCARFPECKGIRDLDGKTQEDLEREAYTDEFKKTYKTAPKTEDGRDYLLRTGRYGKFWAHPDYPKVKDARPLEYKKTALVKMYGNPPKTEDGRDFLYRTGKFGKFWAHPDYPEVKETVRIKEKKSTE
ncbi:MAG: type I DNA topoisomerase [Candidatus Dojkabacteria bacterium]